MQCLSSEAAAVAVTAFAPFWYVRTLLNPEKDRSLQETHMRVFVLGAGATGGLLARLLSQNGYQVSCGDRDPDRAVSFAGDAVEIVEANARRCDSVARAASGCDLLINTVPAVFNQTVIRAALSLDLHYLDMASHLGRTPFKPEQFHFQGDFVRRRRLALINAGAAPGLSNLMAAWCAERLDTVETVLIRLFENTDSDLPVSMWSGEVAYDEAISRPPVFRNGRFQLGRRFDEVELFPFPRPIGKVTVVLAAQDEVSTLPRFIEMRNLDVKIGGNEIDRLRECTVTASFVRRPRGACVAFRRRPRRRSWICCCAKASFITRDSDYVPWQPGRRAAAR